MLKAIAAGDACARLSLRPSWLCVHVLSTPVLPKFQYGRYRLVVPYEGDHIKQVPQEASHVAQGVVDKAYVTVVRPLHATRSTHHRGTAAQQEPRKKHVRRLPAAVWCCRRILLLYTSPLFYKMTHTSHALSLPARSGEVLESSPWQHITNSDLSSAAEGFVGEVQQLPSMWSSSKYKNKPLRWYAERGEVVAREPKSVYITSIQLWRGPQQPHSNRRGAGSSGAQAAVSDTVFFRVVASKGASVRVLVHDLGRVLGCGAHVTAVRREGIGGFSVETAWSLDTLLPLTRKYAKGFRQAPQYQGVV